MGDLSLAIEETALSYMQTIGKESEEGVHIADSSVSSEAHNVELTTNAQINADLGNEPERRAPTAYQVRLLSWSDDDDAEDHSGTIPEVSFADRKQAELATLEESALPGGCAVAPRTASRDDADGPALLATGDSHRAAPSPRPDRAGEDDGEYRVGVLMRLSRRISRPP